MTPDMIPRLWSGARVLAIDPGVAYFGWAWGCGRALGSAGYVKGLTTAGLPVADLLIVELPQTYDSSNPTTIRDLTMAAGQLLADYRAARDQVGPHLHQLEVWTPTPAQWKGQVPKTIHQARIWRKLAETERAELLALGKPSHRRAAPGITFPGKLGHAMDAAGMLLRYWRR